MRAEVLRGQYFCGTTANLLRDRDVAQRVLVVPGCCAEQGGRTADFGTGDGGVAEEAIRLVTPSTITTTGGGDPSTGSPLDPGFTHGENQSISFGSLPTPLMPKKDVP